jgi:hypothetical protein
VRAGALVVEGSEAAVADCLALSGDVGADARADVNADWPRSGGGCGCCYGCGCGCGCGKEVGMKERKFREDW